MAGILDSFKKVYENKKAHIWIFGLAFVWSVLSNLFDIAIGKPDSFRQNPFDLIFNFLLGIYSLQFLHNSIVADGSMPSFKGIEWRALPGLVGLNIVWGVYLALSLIIAVILIMVWRQVWVIPAVLLLAIILISVFVYYVFLAYAEDFDFKGLCNIKLIFRALKVAFKETYIKLLLFILVTIAFVALYFLIYILATLGGIDKLGHIAADYYIFDMVMYAIVGYFLIITWAFAFPYSLIKTYIEKVRPVIKEGVSND